MPSRCRSAAFAPYQYPRLRRDFSQSRRDCILQPRVARHELPWVTNPETGPTLKGLHPILLRAIRALESTLSGLMGIVVGSLPSVAPSSQRWAEGWNPVGIQERRLDLVGKDQASLFSGARSAARKPPALAIVSSYSASGTLSATMPAPTWK